MFLVDTVEGRIVSDKEIKRRLASQQPYAEWVKDNQIMMSQLPSLRGCTHLTRDSSAAAARLRIYR